MLCLLTWHARALAALAGQQSIWGVAYGGDCKFMSDLELGGWCVQLTCLLGASCLQSDTRCRGFYLRSFP